jgi:hypothetical protein
MKKTVKIASIIMMMLIVLSTGVASVYAVDLPTITDPTSTEINKIGGQIIGLIRAIGAVVAVGILIVLGIKYMTASAEGKADFKSSMIPYLVGAVLVFAGSWVASAIVGAISGIQ